MCWAGSFRFGATRTDEQQAERKERHSKHKQWYQALIVFPHHPTLTRKRGGGIILWHSIVAEQCGQCFRFFRLCEPET